MKKSSSFLLFVLVFPFSILFAQVRPGQLYDSGEEISGPRFGITSTIPDGWAGVLPMNTEVFLLMPKDNEFGQIYIMAQEDSFEEMKLRWQEGIDLDNGVYIKSKEGFEMRNGALTSALTVSGSQSSGYVEARCGEYGICLIAFMFSPPERLEKLTSALIDFSDAIQFSEPRDVDPNENFDWRSFLGNKFMASLEKLQGSKKESEVWFCPDGSFRSKLKRKGAFAGQGGDYEGSKKGNWEVAGDGPSTTLTMHFKNLPDLDLELSIDSEQIFINGQRFFFMEDDSCR